MTSLREWKNITHVIILEYLTELFQGVSQVIGALDVSCNAALAFLCAGLVGPVCDPANMMAKSKNEWNEFDTCGKNVVIPTDVLWRGVSGEPPPGWAGTHMLAWRRPDEVDVLWRGVSGETPPIRATKKKREKKRRSKLNKPK